MKKGIVLFFGLLLISSVSIAGNPERIGQAGAMQLLINPWANTAGFNNINIGSANGVTALGINPAGMATTRRTELVFSHTRWLVGSDININTFGVSQSLKKSGVIGGYVSSYDMGEFIRTDEDHPDGGLGTFSPTFMNLGISYAKKFTDHIYIGTTIKVVSEAIPDASASGIALDAGVQYRTNLGRQDSLHSDRLKIGLSLRNIGTTMKYDGDGLKVRANLFDNKFSSQVQRIGAAFEMPSQLNLGASYDFYMGLSHRITVLGAFTSNTFSYDQFGGGVEYQFKKYLSLRYSLLYEKDIFDSEKSLTAFTGHAAGITLEIPFKSGKKQYSSFGISYSYRTTNPFQGTHGIGIRLDL